MEFAQLALDCLVKQFLLPFVEVLAHFLVFQKELAFASVAPNQI